MCVITFIANVNRNKGSSNAKVCERHVKHVEVVQISLQPLVIQVCQKDHYIVDGPYNADYDGESYPSCIRGTGCISEV
jgi:hypothetical protein